MAQSPDNASERVLAKLRLLRQALDLSSKGCEFSGAAISATDVLIFEFATEHDMPPEFWLAVGRLRGATIDCGNPRTVLDAFEAGRPYLNTAAGYEIAAVTQALERLDRSAGELRLAHEVVKAEAAAEAQAKGDGTTADDGAGEPEIAAAGN